MRRTRQIIRRTFTAGLLYDLRFLLQSKSGYGKNLLALPELDIGTEDASKVSVG